jgi:hypothetical protein
MKENEKANVVSVNLKCEGCNEIQSVSKRALQQYSKCYCVASVTKKFTLTGVQTIPLQSSFSNTLHYQ